MTKGIRYNDQQQCAHTWASQLEAAGRASNFFFEGATIYSYGYHFPIATVWGNTVFFTERKRSVSTSRHKNIVHSAVSHKSVVYVDRVSVNGDPFTDNGFQRHNVDYWVGKIQFALTELRLSPKRPSLVRKVEQYVDRLQTFLHVLNIRPTKTLQRLLNSPTIKDAIKYMQEESQRSMLKEKRQRGRMMRKHLSNLCKWEQGKIRFVNYADVPAFAAGVCFLRLHPTKEIIETSKGVKVPVPEAFECWKFVQRCLQAGRMVGTYRVLNIKIDSVSTECLKVGCHDIPIDQVHKIAAALRWL